MGIISTKSGPPKMPLCSVAAPHLPWSRTERHRLAKDRPIALKAATPIQYCGGVSCILLHIFPRDSFSCSASPHPCILGGARKEFHPKELTSATTTRPSFSQEGRREWQSGISSWPAQVRRAFTGAENTSILPVLD